MGTRGKTESSYSIDLSLKGGTDFGEEDRRLKKRTGREGLVRDWEIEPGLKARR
jgi:hypothetical protein